MVAKVLLFDSGVGARAVDMALRARIPAVQTILIEDTGGFPYGTRPDAWVSERVQDQLACAIAAHNPTHVLVACNTASFAVGANLQAAMQLPVYLTFPPLAEAVRLTATRHIAVLVTPTTAKHQGFQRRLAQIKNAGMQVTLINSGELAPMAEQLLRHKQQPDLNTLRMILSPIIKQMGIDIVVLGCTHYGFLSRYMQQIIGREVIFLDSAEQVAQRLVADLKQPAQVRKI